MLVQRSGLELLLYGRPRHQDGDVSATMSSVSAGFFIKNHNQ